MKVHKISKDDALTLSGRSEDHFFDRKSLSTSGKQLQKLVVAFANADGGEVVLGVADDKHEPDVTKRWQGAKSVEDFNGLLQAVFALDPAVDVRYEFAECEDFAGLILRLFIERGADVNKTSDGTVYQRHGAQSLPLQTPERISELAFAKGAQSYENMKVAGAAPESIVDADEIRSRDYARGMRFM